MKKVTDKLIPVNEPLLDGNEKKYLMECVETGWVSSEGPFVKQFEDAFAERVNRKFAISVCNGSAALEVAITALDIRENDEVILPAFTIISCAAPIVRAGAIPVVIDSDPQTWNIDVAKIEERITKRTKAIMVVHIYGLPVDMEPILALAKKYNLKVIEDAAEAIGQTYNGKSCGSFGDISAFSFYPNKHITTGEGGMVTTDNEELAQRCLGLRNLCFQPERRFVHEQLGWNFRMTNMQAALGLAQLERLDEHIKRKRQIGRLYNQLLADVPGLQLPLTHTDYAENIYWVYGLVIKEDIDFDAKEVMIKLGKHKIGTRPFFWPMHEQPVFRKMGLYRGESFPIAERLARRGFYVPSGLSLTDRQIQRVVQCIKDIMK
ncbi:MAG: DegT/DnrJ/EryC1/StrS family aminotransferase [Planctomycetes bacterium]|nr:DegT/DnrJ/EryC1/StrS family aminotransferase [Planctomycetota bacterium]MCK5642849.1 DegT/DnrJ/EryC1/StrS family aminotransferase [Gammaproteobacteria bacterium]